METRERVVLIEKARGIVPIDLRELWEYRELAWFFVTRDFKSRYRQMALGPLWLIIGPVVNTLLYTILFGYVAKVKSDGLPYPLFSYSAFLVWGFFASVLDSSARSLVDSRGLIAKVYFPRLLIPVIGVLTALANLLPSGIILAGMLIWFGHAPTWTVVALPAYFLLAALTGMAFGLWWAPWLVHFRDLSNILGYIVKGWMYLSPVVYAASVVPERWRWVYRLNPMTQVVEGVRWALLGSQRPSWWLIAASAVFMFLLLIPAAHHFRRSERSIVDMA